MTRLLKLTAALAAVALASFIAYTTPPGRLTPAEAWDDGSVPGILHVHTNRSDGRSSPDEVAAAAARAGLKFLVFTDHGEGLVKPDPPAYRSGVLCLDGVEISTDGGHYVALDLPQTPYALGGEPRDVVEDVGRLGGFGVAAHPDSPKPELRWRGWDTPFDGVELVNPDTSWRVRLRQPGWRNKAAFFGSLLGYPIRSAERMAALLERPAENLERWTALAASRKVVALAGADAHSKLELRNTDSDSWSLAFPGYESSFRVLSLRVRPDRVLSGDASADAAALVRALRAGHAYSVIDAVASPPAFEFTASNGNGTAGQGDELRAGGPVTLHVRSNAPPGFRTTIWQGTTAIASDSLERDITLQATAEPAVYWVEIRPGGAATRPDWIISNPIYVRGRGPAAAPPARRAAANSRPLFDGKTSAGWSLEIDPQSLGALDVAAAEGGAELRLRWGIGGEPGAKQSVALARAVRDTREGAGPFDRVTFRARAERPMRIYVQFRTRAPGVPDRRWQRSVYLDAISRDHTVFFDDLTPVGAPLADTPERGAPPDLDLVSDILFVVETTNNRPGDSGHVWIRSAALQK